jgi:MFS family permease
MKPTRKINTFKAFENRNYTLFFCGQSVSQIGTWMQRTAVSWVVYSITHSAFMLGLTVFASQFPAFLLTLYGGIISDRFNRHKILYITQTASMLQSLLLAVLVLTNHYNITLILILSTILGIINAFDVPARQPLVHELVRNKDDLPNALALNSAMVNMARLLGPALSGIVLQKFGAGICFMLNAISFVAVLISLLLLKLPPYVRSATKKSIKTELSDGYQYMKRTPSIGLIVLMLSIVSLLVMPYDTLIPVFTKVIFNGDAATYGYICSFMGLGAISATLFLASAKKGTDLKKVLLFATIIWGAGLICFSHIQHFALAMVFAAMAGFGSNSQSTICITLVQVQADPSMRGRMISYVAMAIFGMLPLGSLVTGFVSQKIGAPNTMLIQGIIALIVAFMIFSFLRKNKLDEEKQTELAAAENALAEEM